MTLQLSALQKHCLAGIGIKPWQQRSNAVCITKSVINDMPDNELDITVHVVNEAAASYEKSSGVDNDLSHNNNDSIIPPAFITEIELATNYVKKHSGVQLDWKIDQHASSLSLIDNTLIIPNTFKFLTTSDIKKQAWMLISKV